PRPRGPGRPPGGGGGCRPPVRVRGSGLRAELGRAPGTRPAGGRLAPVGRPGAVAVGPDSPRGAAGAEPLMADVDPGSIPTPDPLGAALDALARQVKMNGTEWRVLALILVSPGPLSAWRLAAELNLPYRIAKRVAKGLAEWHLLERQADGLVFQPDS